MEASQQKTTLQPRRTPTQHRSRKRVDDILDAVAELLVERGFEAITTRLIAEKANIPVGSIYQFFPNKFAVFNALAHRFLHRISLLYQEFIPGEVADLGWEESLDRAIDAFAKILFAEAAIPILWAGMQHSEELRAAEADHIARGVDYNLVMLDNVLGHVEPERRRLIAWIMVRVLDALLYHATHSEAPAREQTVEELKLILKAYVRSHIDGQ
jgi:AcrR family transcriptional regulator